MEIISGGYVMQGCDRSVALCSIEGIASLIHQIGFLPLFSNGISGFSVEEHVPADVWWTGDSHTDPWEWRMMLAADPYIDSGISYKNDSTKEYFVKLFSHMKHYQDICLALSEAGLMHIVKDQFDRVFLEIHRNEYDDYKSYFLAGGIYNVFYLWLTKGCKESPDELADRLESILEK